MNGTSSSALQLMLRHLAMGALSLGFLACGTLAWAAPARPAPPQSDSASSSGRTIQYASGDSHIPAYVATPSQAGKHPAVIIVHDVAGVDDKMQAIARQLADAGFVAMVPDLISRDESANPFAAIQRLPLYQPISDLKAAFSFLQQDPEVEPSRISVVGFGWGGWRAFKLAEDTPSLYRLIIYYGTTPTDSELKKVQAPVLAHYAQYDFRNTGNAVFTEDELGAKFKYYVYRGADRGFMTTSGPYATQDEPANAEARKLSWARTLEFLK